MAKERRGLNGRVVAITGGAQGIGKATAEALVQRGARVAIGDIDLALAERTATGLGGGTVALPLDVSDRASFESFLSESERQLGPLDVVINNAGIMPVTPFVEETEESFRRQIDINFVGVIHGTQLAMERMMPRNAGHIVNIASQAGKSGFPGIATYSATKHAVVGLSEAVRQELRGRAVEISCVMPTVVNTELTAGVGQKWVKPVEATDVADAIVAALEVPKFDVYVPKFNGALLRAGVVMPRAVTEGINRAMGTDKLMTQVDHTKRAAYEERAAHSVAEGEEAPRADAAPDGTALGDTGSTEEDASPDRAIN